MILKAASRFAFSRSGTHRSRSIRIVLSLALTLAALVVIISIMDYLQNTQFEGIREVRSFDLVLEGRHKDEVSDLLPGKTVFEYGEGEALAGNQAFFVRYVDEDYDGGLHVALKRDGTILIPYSLYKALGSSSVEVSVLRKGKSGATVVKTLEYEMAGVFYTTLGDSFDSTMLFLPVSEADATVSFRTAVKDAGEKERKILEGAGFSVSSYLEEEQSLHSAFVLEKAMMYAVLAMLFLVIAVSLWQSVRVFVSSRRRELSGLQLLGMGEKELFLVLALSFLYLLTAGLASGLVLGRLTLPLVENLMGAWGYGISGLAMPWTPVLVFSCAMFLLTLVFVLLGEKTRRKTDIWEVVHGE